MTLGLGLVLSGLRGLVLHGGSSLLSELLLLLLLEDLHLELDLRRCWDVGVGREGVGIILERLELLLLLLRRDLSTSELLEVVCRGDRIVGLLLLLVLLRLLVVV